MKIAIRIKVLLMTIIGFLVFGCTIEDGKDLNGPETASISEGVSRPELPQVVSGILADMRDRLNTQIDVISVVGRDYWRHQSSDPRWTGDLMTGVLDDNAFYLTTPYAARYAVVKECNLLLEGLENTTTDFSEAEKSAIRGFANTIKAHELLTVLNMLYQNGIRTDVADPDNLGGFEGYDAALTTILGLLNTAATDLATGGDVSPNTLGVSYLEFNRALTARVAAYQGNYSLVLSALDDSFMDFAGDMYIGAYYQFSAAGSDELNQLFFALNSTGANARIAHPDFVNSAEAGDNRLDKAVLRTDGPLNIADLTPGTHDVYIYESNTDPVAMIRNEELILLYAEANMTDNPGEAEMAINVVRDAAGLGPVVPGSVDEDRLLYERRYSLFAEGHRWIDLRRFNRLDELVIDRAGDNRVTQFPIPQNEGQ
ncbi:RagB/SusD family nutrient uptake outer membrane protein [Arenibacter echinorum]|uniref:SusD-like starch-binding protein associating with outer membrane n=1 Tax=Arenibacter echinorum TaxID=440515 RepID=A0A327RKS6_9FLAO|nr:RagB/SusD family nutrient uptake outer membrane protein [Arenibacter echinorum]RAJ14337.1 SusD-like starch-binding protein associating with outer membrane [Arenibacter echinorum]